MTVGEWQLARQRLEYNGTNRNYSGNRRNDCHSMVVHMSEYKWCHGPKCHTYKTQDRVRGTKGSKVLRTRKLKEYRYLSEGIELASELGIKVDEAELIKTNSTGLTIYNPTNLANMIKGMKNKEQTREQKIYERMKYEKESVN